MGGVGDVNGDGLADFAVGQSLLVKVYSGKDRSILYTFPSFTNLTGEVIRGVGDLNADGTPDFRVHCWSGDDYTSLHSGVDGGPIAPGEFAILPGALDVQGAGDVDGDGAGDLIALYPRSGTEPTEVRVLAGIGPGSLQVLVPRVLYSESISFPFSVATAGGEDVNGDGFSDFLVSSQSVSLHSGANGTPLWTRSDIPFGPPVSAVKDVNGDGILDFVGVTPIGGAASWAVLSGADGTTLMTGDPALSPLATPRLVGLGDVDGDGRGDFFLGVPSPWIEASLMSGTGRRLTDFPEFSPYLQTYGALGDVDGDGLDDYGFGWHDGAGQEFIEVRSGRPCFWT